MTNLLQFILGRIPVGWLQLSHNRARMIAAVAGIAFANLLVFVQLGVKDSLSGAVTISYAPFKADIMISSRNTDMLYSGSLVSRRVQYLALADQSIEAAVPLYLGTVEWKKPGGSTAVLSVYGLPPEAKAFAGGILSENFDGLKLPYRALIDNKIIGIDLQAVQRASSMKPMEFQIDGTSFSAIGSFGMGGGFGFDGLLAVSDQTFFLIFDQRSAATPNHILIKLKPGEDADLVAARLNRRLSAEHVKVRTLATSIADDKIYQNTQMPTGIIFAFGVAIGLIVGLVIVYQVLSTDVVAHLKEYATFKAMGYTHSFFLGVIFEEAVIVALMGFVPGFLLSWGAYAAMASSTGLPVEMTATRSIAIFVGTVAACTVSGALATLRLRSADPAELFS